MPNKKKSRRRRQSGRSNNKKSSSGKQKEVSINELIEAADATVLRGEDPMQAISLYDAAMEKLAGSSSRTTEAGDNANGGEEFLQATILEKRAEAKVSVGDKEGARHDYQLALDSLQQEASSEIITQDADPTDNTRFDPDLVERTASLQMYIGQLSEGKEARERYRQGISLWRSCLEAREMDLASGGAPEQGSPPVASGYASGDKMEGEGDVKDGGGSVDESQRRRPSPRDKARETRRQLAAAYCSAAELYLTDLCDEEDAESECEAMAEHALRLTDPVDGEPVVDALQTMASLRLSQRGRRSEALDHVLRVYGRIEVGCQALASLVGLREESGGGNVEQREAKELLELNAVQALPGFEFRCQTAKLLLECAALLKEGEGDEGEGTDRANQCVKASIDVLGSLLAENDEVIEIWTLAGDAFAALIPPNPELASHYWERSTEMLDSVRQSLERESDEVAGGEEEQDVRQQLDEVNGQLQQVKTKLSEVDPEKVGGTAPMEE